MKVLQINKFFYLKGGAEKHFLALIELLEGAGHELSVFSMRDKKNLPSADAEYFAAPVNLEKFSFRDSVKYFRNSDAIEKLRLLIRQKKPDIAHLHNIAHQLTPAIIKVLKDNKIPVVQTLHDYKLICPNYKLFTQNQICYRCRGKKYYNCFTHRCIDGVAAKSFMAMCEMYYNDSWHKYYDLVDLFIAPSRFMKDVCVSFGIAAERIEVLPNFIGRGEYPILRAEQPADDYLIYFGRLAYEKGVGTLIEALTRVPMSLRLKIVGSGPGEADCRKMVTKYRLDDRVEFTGFQQDKKLRTLIQGARAVVVPSLWNENWPFSVLEAMALGKVIIASKAGGMPEMLGQGKFGLLFEPGDSQQLSDLINKIYKKDHSYLGAAARQEVDKYNPADYLKHLSKIYKRLIKK